MGQFERWVGCLVLGHQFVIVQELTPRSRRVGCERCMKSWGMNDDVRSFIPWTEELATMYRDVFRITLREWPR